MGTCNPPPQSTDPRSHQTETWGCSKPWSITLPLQPWHLLPGRQPHTYKAQGWISTCFANSAENKCPPWITVRETMHYRNLTAGKLKKKKIFTKVLHHRHISHCWQNETFGDKRRLNTEFKSLLLAGFVLPFRGDTDVENKGLTHLFYMHLQNHRKT